MTALIITALSTAAQTLLYAGLAFGCGVVGLATCAALMGRPALDRIAAYALFAAYIVAYLLGWDWDANAHSLGNDALGEVGEGDRAAGHLVQRNKSKAEF